MLWKIITLSGILCLAYYGLICALLKKWDSTFSRFWPVAGAVFLLLGYWKPRAVVPFLAVSGILFLLVECRILAGMVPCREKNIPYLVVLGAQVKGTRLSGSLYRRIEKAGQYLADNPETVVIVSGGQGKGEDITEALAMKQYLTDRGISSGRIFLEEKSTTTRENLQFSAEYIAALDQPVGIVTNNFHMYRACCYAKKLGYQSPKPVPAGCSAVLFVNYMVREFFAFIKMLNCY